MEKEKKDIGKDHMDFIFFMGSNIFLMSWDHG